MRGAVTRRLSWLVAGAMACAAGAVASASCGGTVVTGAAPDASSDGKAASDGTTGGPDGTSGGPDASFDSGIPADSGTLLVDGTSPCPATPPTQGTSCAPNLVCEYGASWWLECDVVMRCSPTGQGPAWAWSLEFDGGGCPWLDSGGACPATWAEANAVDAAPSTCPFVTCVYPEGFCGCGIGCGGGGGIPRPLDVTGHFSCIPSSGACPEPRPRSGSVCEEAGTYCNYSFACGCGQDMGCASGVWQGNPAPPCP